MPQQVSNIARRGKEYVGCKLLQAARLGRIHIIGCSRSGTTLLHQAMIAFDDTIISKEESNIWYPYLGDRFFFFVNRMLTTRKQYLVTKRSPNWHLPDQVINAIRIAKLENVSILNIIRDPRDVLTSKHARSPDRLYVAPEHWLNSMLAAETISNELAGFVKMATIRYEDLITEPKHVSEQLCHVFGLRLTGRCISDFPANLALRGHEVSKQARDNLSSVRDFESYSIGRWRKEGFDFHTIPDRAVVENIGRVIERHGYDSPNGSLINE